MGGLPGRGVRCGGGCAGLRRLGGGGNGGGDAFTVAGWGSEQPRRIPTRQRIGAPTPVAAPAKAAQRYASPPAAPGSAAETSSNW